jgi:hypothetical protein
MMIGQSGEQIKVKVSPTKCGCRWPDKSDFYRKGRKDHKEKRKARGKETPSRERKKQERSVSFLLILSSFFAIFASFAVKKLLPTCSSAPF